MPSLIPIIVVAFVVIVVVAFYTAAQRRKALSAWAQRNGLSFEKSHDPGVGARFRDFKCLQRGRSRYAYNSMTGRWSGREMIAFDYHYVTGSGKNRSTHHFSAVILQSPIPLKPLSIRREGLFDKLTEFFGLDDIDFESAEFSRTFYVKSPDKKWAYDVIHQRMMEYLLAAPTFAVQFDDRHAVAWRSSRFKPKDFQNAAEFLSGLFDRFPDYLVRQQMRAGAG